MTSLSNVPSISPARYRATTYPSIRDADWDVWNGLRDVKSDPFMDPRFILAVENSMAADSRFRHVLIHDEQGRPTAAACLCAYSVDGALLAEGGARTVATSIKKVAPFLLRVPVMLCGLPVSAGASHLRFADHADRAAVLSILDGLLCDFAKETRSKCIVFKEFEAAGCLELVALESLGYRRADSLPMNCVPAGYSSFDDYLSRTNSARRRTIRRSKEKFARCGLKVVHRAGGDGVDELFSDDVHRLYEAVLERATVRFERLPAAFFREVARQMPDNSLFTFVNQGDRVVAFAATIFSEELFDQMFIGLDYRLNPECDLYFNVFFEALGAAFDRGPRHIHVGQTSDEFKHQKLTAYQIPLAMYVKGCAWLVNLFLKHRFEWFFPPRPLKYPAPGGPG